MHFTVGILSLVFSLTQCSEMSPLKESAMTNFANDFSSFLKPLADLANNADSTFDIGILITIASTVLAIVLLIVSALAYRRERRDRLLFVMFAFNLFVIKGILFAVHETREYLAGNSHAMFSVEHVALLLDFFVIITLFIALMKK